MSDFQQYFIWISKNIQKDWVFAVFILNTIAAKQKKKKKEDNDTTYKELL